MSKTKKLTYRDAGVDIDAKMKGISNITRAVRSTFNRQVIENVGGFGSLFRPDLKGIQDPVLISSADGVGTKLMVARMMKKYDTVGEDIVNHCVNDILVQGARPLYFLDYVGAGRVKPGMLEAVVAGLARACRANGMSLVGGETAEMPGIYGDDDIDLVGFIVGIADRKKVLTGAGIKPGDTVLGLASTGLHTNGYSLARKLFFDIKKLKVNTHVPALGTTVGKALLAPHRSYYPCLYPLIQRGLIKGLAHITGGGFYDNIPRVLPKGTAVRIDAGTWPVPPVFTYIQKEGNVDLREMHRTFNMGVGMVVVVEAFQAGKVQKLLAKAGEKAPVIGQVVRGKQDVVVDGI
ncbi:MAG: phosphoribosylformylglycinamidine cyclo-ligase [Planctomycetota bacterium]